MQQVIKILLFLPLFACVSAKGQAIEKHKTYYLTLRDTMFLTEYTVRNKSDKNLLIWFDLTGNNGTQKDYFFQTKGDFSLLGIMNDDNVINKRFDVIGESFIRLVKTKDMFSVTVLYRNRKAWSQDLFDRAIIMVNEKDWHPSIKDAIPRNEEYLYEAGSISVLYEALIN